VTHLYFHSYGADRVLLDHTGADIDDLTEARDRAVRIVREIVSGGGPDDWRSWTLRVSDEDGEEIFLMPFACVIGHLH
jgi:hypothetical protein